MFHFNFTILCCILYYFVNERKLSLLVWGQGLDVVTCSWIHVPIFALKTLRVILCYLRITWSQPLLPMPWQTLDFCCCCCFYFLRIPCHLYFWGIFISVIIMPLRFIKGVPSIITLPPLECQFAYLFTHWRSFELFHILGLLWIEML